MDEKGRINVAPRLGAGGSSWNVRRKQPSISELTEAVSEATAAANAALEEEGKYSRAYREAEYVRRGLARRLESAQDAQAEQDRYDKMSPFEVARDVADRIGS